MAVDSGTSEHISTNNTRATSRIFVRPTFSSISVFLAAVFFATALTPSAIPRSPVVLGVVAGIAAAVGFEIGNAIRWLWLFLELPQASRQWRSRLSIVGYGAAAVILVVALWFADDWQNQTRAAVELDPINSIDFTKVLLAAFVAFIVIWALFRLFGILLRAVYRVLSIFVPRRVGFVVGFLLVAWFFWALFDGFLAGTALRAIDKGFATADSFVDPEIPRPVSAEKVGSEESLVDWDTMGQWGRVFIAEAPTAEEIAEFTGTEAMDPVRVYVGLRSAPTPQVKAELALQELIRVGGFERSNLVIVTSTGTGWMDPGAQDTLDFMLGGDVATVAVQYSYLPSAIAVAVDPTLGIKQAEALFDAVYAYWTKLPKDHRPRLFIHGLSLGAFTSQEAFPLLDMLADPIDGALWAGSPYFSPVWQRVREERDPASPVWKPQFGNGSLVRAMNQEGFADADYAPWGPTRLVFLTFGSDPIAMFTYDSGYHPPAWLDDPRPPDLSPSLRWFPFVTMLQIAVDTAFSTTVQSHGHYYSAPEYIDAWAALLDPPGWSEARSDELKEIFADRPPAM